MSPARRLPARVLALLLLCGSARGQQGGAVMPAAPAPSARPALVSAETPAVATAEALLQRLEDAWQARDLPGYLALWDFETADEYEEERLYAERNFAADEARLQLEPAARLGAAGDALSVNATVFTVDEPRGRVDQWLLTLARRAAGWRVAAKQAVGQIDGLVHLSLDPQGVRADGLTLRFEDFELRMAHGTLFQSPATIGPTLLVFVGSGEVRFKPRPEAEREQLRQFSGKPELVQRVSSALARIHPADLHRVLEPVRFSPDPDAAARLAEAERLFHAQGSRAFVLEGVGPRSPWWLLPSVGDSAVSFETRRGTLTFTVSGSEPEGLSLFDRDKRRQICLYPLEGGSTRYSEDAGRAADILEHDLRLRVDPERRQLTGEDTLRINMLAPTSTLRLKLDEALRVESVVSAQAGRHLFFRVRYQDSLMVSLGRLSGTLGEIRLTVRYSGVLHPAGLDSELIQAVREIPPDRSLGEEDVPVEGVLAYTNRRAWYPQGVTEDYATARVRFELPPGYTAVTGGLRSAVQESGERVLVEYVQRQPGRYITAAIGRLAEAASSSEAGVEIEAYAVARLRSTVPQTLKLAIEILRFYATQFGPCPYPKLNLVLAEGYTPGGHSPPGMVLLQLRPVLLRRQLRDDPASVSEAPGFFLAHELAHQWWGHGLAGQNYRERWLSEGFAQYAAVLWVRESRGDDAFQSALRQLSQWALRHTALGPIHLGFRLGHIKGDPQIFRAIVYDKGAYVLRMLNGIVGKDAFRSALLALQAERRFSKIGTDDLREALERASGLDLRPYFEEWIYGTRLPRLRVAQHRQNEQIRVEVVAEDLPGSVPLEITLQGAGRRRERVTLQPGRNSWSFEAGSVSRADVNSDRGILAKIEKLGR